MVGIFWYLQECTLGPNLESPVALSTNTESDGFGVEPVGANSCMGTLQLSLKKAGACQRLLWRQE